MADLAIDDERVLLGIADGLPKTTDETFIVDEENHDSLEALLLEESPENSLNGSVLPSQDSDLDSVPVKSSRCGLISNHNELEDDKEVESLEHEPFGSTKGFSDKACGGFDSTEGDMGLDLISSDLKSFAVPLQEDLTDKDYSLVPEANVTCESPTTLQSFLLQNASTTACDEPRNIETQQIVDENKSSAQVEDLHIAECLQSEVVELEDVVVSTKIDCMEEEKPKNQIVEATCVVDSPKLDGTPTFHSSNKNQNTNSIVSRKFKGFSGVINKCIDNLRQRGLEINASSGDLKASDTVGAVSGDGVDDSVPADSVGSGDGTTRLNSRSHRKSRKPTKVAHRFQMEEINIVPASKTLSSVCSTCSFTCNTAAEIAEHTSVCHSGKIIQTTDNVMFSCMMCKMPAENREQLLFHLAQHPGSHIFRCFTCPYCGVQADHMDIMDDHIGLHHPAEDFRFEVRQERVSYLQNMFECPVCNEAYLWRDRFVGHLVSVHQLKDLASYLESQFSETAPPSSCRISVDLLESFADTLSESAKVADDLNTNEASELSNSGKQHPAVSSKYVLNMEKIVDELFREPDEVDREDFFSVPDYSMSLAAKGITKDVWLTSDSCVPGSDSRLTSMLKGSSKTVKGSDRDSIEAQVGVSEWKDYADVDLRAGVEAADADLLTSNFGGADEIKETMHLSNKRMILRCSLCPFECNRTPNFRRHMAIHERQSEYADGYKCAYCHFQHRRLNCIRFHLGKYHNHLPPRICRIVGGSQVSVMESDAAVVSTPDAVNDVPLDREDFVKKELCDDLDLSQTLTGALATTESTVLREKRLSKPPKRLSDTLDFQSPVPSASTSIRLRRTSLESNGAYPSDEACKSSYSRYETAAEDKIPLMNKGNGKPFDESISADYYQSSLPPGMIYQNPIKCPRCDFTNRVRINLVRHMKQHRIEDELDRTTDPSTIIASKSPQAWDARDGDQTADPPSSQGRGADKRNDDFVGQREVVVKNEPDYQDTAWNSAAIDTSVVHRQLHRPTNSPGMQTPHGMDHIRSNRKRSAIFSDEEDESPHDNNAQKITRTEHAAEYTSNEIARRHEMDLCLSDGESRSMKRLFKCAYCSVSSRWNRRDISLHILHVHIRRRAFRCRRCGYSTSKSSSAVTVHCARTHPGRPAVIEDNLAVLNTILPVHARPGLVHVAFRRPDGTPEFDIRELERYFGLSPETDNVEKPKAVSRVRIADKRPPPADESPSSAMPLDLSAVNHKTVGRTEHAVADRRLIDDQYSDKNSHKASVATNVSMKREVLHVPRVAFDSRTTTTNVASSSALSVSQQHVSSVGAKAAQPLKPKSSSQASPNAAFYRCRQCGYQDQRHDKTKYHVVREHLHLGPYGCVYCPRYMWGRRHVARHIDSTHPGMPIKIRRAFDEFETYLRQNIRKIGGMPERLRPSNKLINRLESAPLPQPSEISTKQDMRSIASISDVRSMGEDLSAVAASSVGTRNPVYQCGHCDFRDSLAARVQGHCLAKHPSKPIQYRRCEDMSGIQPSSDAVACGLKIESVESMSTGRGLSVPQLRVGNGASKIDCSSRPPMKTVQAEQVGRAAEHLGRGVRGSRSDDNHRNATVEMSASSIPVDSHSILSSENDDYDDEDEDDDDDGGLSSDGFPMFVCWYCPEMAWSEDEVRMHVQTMHPGQPLKFGHTQQSEEQSAKVTKEPAMMEDEAEVLSSDDDQQDTGNESKGQSGGLFIYRCRICRYRSDKVTVVRHHVMAHLLYHPYRCPYCDTVRSVKSSPITKHIRGPSPWSRANLHMPPR